MNQEELITIERCHYEALLVRLGHLESEVKPLKHEPEDEKGDGTPPQKRRRTFWQWFLQRQVMVPVAVAMVVILGVGVSGASSKQLQLGVGAYEALSKLQSKLEVGMSFMAYKDALGDAHHAAKKFLESPEAMEVPTFTKQIIVADNAFRMAGELWGERIKEQGGLYPAESKFAKAILKVIPDVPIKRDRPEAFPSGYMLVKDIEGASFRTAFKALKKAKLYLDQLE